MTDDIKPQPNLEPVHVRKDQPVAAAPAETAKPASIAPPAAAQPSPQKPQPAKVVKKAPQPSSSGVTLAIVATVVIILGLAGLAVLAYVKTQK